MIDMFFMPLALEFYSKNQMISISETYVEGDNDNLKRVLDFNKAKLEDKYVFDSNVQSSNVKQNLFLYFTPSKKVYEYGEWGWIFYSLLVYADKFDDKELLTKLKYVFDKTFIDNQYHIERTDQAIYGCCAIELYKKFSDVKYKIFSDSVFQFLLLNSVDGVVLYRKDVLYQSVDVLGFVVPFLSLYENDSLTSSKQIQFYMDYGVDLTTGCPVQGFNLVTKTKTGRSNWGRGWAWYSLALLFNKEPLGEEYEERTRKFQNSLLSEINEKGYFTQFIGETDVIDFSATLPLFFYMLNANMDVSEKYIDSLLGKHMRINGEIVPNSPSISISSPSLYRMPHYLSQAMGLLVLIQK